MCAFVGCGDNKLIEVKGVVTHEGKAVEGATVTFVSEDGKNTASASTDAGGNFSLVTGGKPGAPPGTYKVLVVKGKHQATDTAPDPSDPATMAQLKKESEEVAKDFKGAGGVDMATKMKMKMAGQKVEGGGPAPVHSLLPAAYADIKTTPFTVKVPPDSQPVQLDLKGK